VIDEEVPAVEGTGLVNAAFVGTGLLVGTSAAAALAPDTFGRLHAVLAVVLFAVGTGALLWAYALGVSRSREDAVTIGGLFFLAGGIAPATVRRPFRVALAVEVVAVLAAAAARPYTEVAFGILAPMFPLGLMGTWAGRYGVFPPRPPKGGRS
jgi:hypothetical protein